MDTNNAKNLPDSREETTLSRFFSQKTVEGRYLLGNFTPAMIADIIENEQYFTEEDIRIATSCSDPRDCIYKFASIRSRIRSELPLSASSTNTDTVPVSTEEVRTKIQALLPKE